MGARRALVLMLGGAETALHDVTGPEQAAGTEFVEDVERFRSSQAECPAPEAGSVIGPQSSQNTSVAP